MNNPTDIWNKCLNIIADNVSAETFNTWFKPIVPLSYSDNELTIQVPSPFFYEHLEDKFLGLLSETIRKVAGDQTRLMYRAIVENKDGSALKFESSPSYKVKETAKNKSGQPKIMRPFEQQIFTDLDPQLNANYCFTNFICGNSNKLARSAGETVAGRPGKTAFNPLFIYGASGVGKTHLLHAIGSAVKEYDQKLRVLYVSTHLFQLQYTDAVRNNTQNDFINFYQSIDVLIIDDIQELMGKEKTQYVFFNIFNHLHQLGKQLILSCDKHPGELLGMEDRLLSRFKWGLTAQLESPDVELRKCILKSKIHHDGLVIPEDVIEHIATSITGSVRDLEGVLVSLMAHSTVFNKEIEINLANRVLEKYVKNTKKEITPETIQKAVCTFYNVDPKLLQSTSRKREIVNARQVAMFLSKKYTDQSFSRIGEIIGKKDHATVVHACKVVKGLISINKDYKTAIEEIETMLK